MTKVVKSPAPELTPIIFGLARGLFKTDWRINPAMDKAHPTSIAAKVLGILT